jgi:hypothetical protein
MAKQTFTTGQVLTAAQMTSLQQTAMGGGSATAKTVSYTLVAADAGTTIIMNSGSATTITVNTSLFAAGDTVFIVNQGAGVCTITAGTATVTTAASLAMGQNETGQLYFVSTGAAIFTEYMQAAAGGGKLLQVVQGSTATETTTASTTFADTTLTASITPSASTSKILVLVCQQIRVGLTTAAGDQGGAIRLVRNSTSIFNGTKDYQTLYIQANQVYDIASYTNITYLDSPATTSSVTYKTQQCVYKTTNGGSIKSQWGEPTSTITLLEIGA